MATCFQKEGLVIRQLFLLLIIAIPTYGFDEGGNIAPRNLSLTGVVVDSVTGRPLEGATVYIATILRGTSTDTKGEFSFDDLLQGRYRVVFRMLGYHDRSMELELFGDSHRRIKLGSETIELPGITVRGKNPQEELTRANQSVAILTPVELDRTRGQTLGETLKQIPGVTALQTGPSISKPVVRGLHSERVLVLNGGIPQEGQQWGGEHAPEIDPFAASRIEVLKGAAGVEYGAGAIGGVIRIEPAPWRDTPGIDGQLSLNGFSNNRQGAGSLFVEGAHSWFPGLAWRLRGTYRKAGNTETPNYVLGNTGFDEFDGSVGGSYTLERTLFEAQYSYFDTELGIYRGSHIGSISDLTRAITAGGPLTDYDFSYDIKPPKQVISHELWSIKAAHTLPSIGELSLQFGRQSNHRQEYDAYRFFNNMQTLPTRAAFDLTLTTYTLDLRLKHQPVGDFYGTLGASGLRQGNIAQGTSFLIPNFRSYSGGIYLIETWTRGVLTVNAGARYDHRWLQIYPYPPRILEQSTHTYGNISGSSGIIYQFAPEWSISGNAGTAFRPPSVNELYSYGVHHGTAEFESGDPNLKNERSYSVDATLRYVSSKTRVEVSAYNNYMQNFIFLFPNPVPVLTLRGAFPSFSYKQANSVLRGVDGAFEHWVVDWYQIGITFSFVRGTNLVTGEPLIQMPSDRLRASNTVHLPSSDFFNQPFAELSATLVRRQDRYPLNVDYLSPPPGFATVDFTLGANIVLGAEPLQCSLSVHNVFDIAFRDYLSRFRYFVDDPGRDIILRLNVPFGQSDRQVSQ
jgi:iron complex outermembrane recepter protein